MVCRYKKMQIWKGKILCLISLLSGMAFAVELQHMPSCNDHQTDWRPAGNMIPCPKKDCPETYYDRLEAYCPNCNAPVITEWADKGCAFHQFVLSSFLISENMKKANYSGRNVWSGENYQLVLIENDLFFSKNRDSYTFKNRAIRLYFRRNMFGTG
jgi:hypothetical protein